MKLSEIIAKAEAAVVKGVKVAAVKSSELAKQVRVEMRASAIAEGEAERLRTEAALGKPIDQVSVLDLRQVVEAAEVEERARQILEQRERKEELRLEHQRRKEYAKRVLRGEIPLPAEEPKQ